MDAETITKQADMENNWGILKEKINEQIADCGKYGSRFQRPYREVLKMMAAIENGTQEELKPNNCLWKTEEEIKQCDE